MTTQEGLLWSPSSPSARRACVICFDALCDAALSTDAFVALVWREYNAPAHAADCVPDAHVDANALLQPPAAPPCHRRSSTDAARRHQRLHHHHYYAVGERAQCAEQHLLCTSCAVHFALDATNDSCPLCRGPLRDVVRMCHAWAIERERADYMCAQQAALRDIATECVGDLRDQLRRAVACARRDALYGVRYRLWPESDNDTYTFRVRRRGANVEWQYASRGSRVQRHCHVPLDREYAADAPSLDANGFAHVPAVAQPASVTLAACDWHRLCYDLFGLRVEPVPRTIMVTDAAERRQRAQHQQASRSRYSAKRKRSDVNDGGGGDEDDDDNDLSSDDDDDDMVDIAVGVFDERCDTMLADVRYNTRAPCRKEMMALLRRRDADTGSNAAAMASTT